MNLLVLWCSEVPRLGLTLHLMGYDHGHVFVLGLGPVLGLVLGLGPVPVLGHVHVPGPVPVLGHEHVPEPEQHVKPVSVQWLKLTSY